MGTVGNVRRPWREELAIVDRTMRAISGVTDPEELVAVYWENIGELVRFHDYVALSRRDVDPPGYLVTRSSRFAVGLNPWTQRDQLPRLSGGLLGEIIYADAPVIIDDLPARLSADDPGWFYLQGFESLVALPQYDDGRGLNATVTLFPPGVKIDPAMIPMFHWQAGLFGRGTQNLVLRNQLGEVLATLNRELRAVGDIQRSLLPEALPVIPGFELATAYQTSALAGGDYYDFFPLAGGAWGLFIADVAGHGTPAAVLMAITHAVAHARPGAHTPPAALLAYLNDRLTQAYTRGGMFVTAFYAVLDPARGTLTYARAGHNPPRLCGGGTVRSLDRAGGLPLGILDGQAYGEATVTLAPGDLLLLYTDGITEAMSPRQDDANGDSGRRELFGTDRLDAVLLGCCEDTTARACVDRVRAAVVDFAGQASPVDDQTLIAVRHL